MTYYFSGSYRHLFFEIQVDVLASEWEGFSVLGNF